MKLLCIALLCAICLTCRADEEEEDSVFTQCLKHEICVEKYGITIGLGCMAELGNVDTQAVLEYFREFYNQPQNANMREIFEAGCEDVDKAKVGFNDYMDNRNDPKNQDKFPPEDFAKLMQTRSCFVGMVEECLEKKSMGVL